MSNLAASVPVILLDGLLASGSSVISIYVGQSYSFAVINGNQYLRDLGTSTGFVKAPLGTFDHEKQLLEFYEFIAKEDAKVHDQIYSFLTSKVSIAKLPTIVHCTGYAAYALNKHLPVKQTYWLHATMNDRVERLLTKHEVNATALQKEELMVKLQEVDDLWDTSLQTHLGIKYRDLEQQPEIVVDTTNLSAEQAFQKLAMVDSFVQTYNSLASLMPAYHEEWRRWQCLVCQLVVETNKVVLQCPRCGNTDPDKFSDIE